MLPVILLLIFLVVFVVCTKIYLYSSRKNRENVDIIFPEKNDKDKTITITTPYVIKTHTDADGAGPAILANYYFGKENVRVMSTPNAKMDSSIRDIPNWVFECHTTIFITDISCSVETAQILDDFMKTNPSVSIVLLDHHKTALDLNKFEWCKVMVEKDENSFQILDKPIKNEKTGELDYGLSCGTSLFYEYLIDTMGVARNETVDKFVNLVTGYDTWMWRNYFNGEEIYQTWDTYFELLGWNMYLEKMLDKLENNALSFTDMDEFAFSIEKNNIDATVKRAMNRLYFCKWHGYNTCFVQCDSCLSEITDEIFAAYGNLDIVCMVAPSKLSLRSRRDDVDVAKIAKELGGGGHTNAAGCSIPWEITKKYYWLFK